VEDDEKPSRSVPEEGNQKDLKKFSKKDTRRGSSEKKRERKTKKVGNSWYGPCHTTKNKVSGKKAKKKGAIRPAIRPEAGSLSMGNTDHLEKAD